MTSIVLLFDFSVRIELISKIWTKHMIFFFYRYAMTVWYFDAEERAEAKKKFRNLTGMTFTKYYSKKSEAFILEMK
mgnify:CR=1 FL=1